MRNLFLLSSYELKRSLISREKNTMYSVSLASSNSSEQVVLCKLLVKTGR